MKTKFEVNHRYLIWDKDISVWKPDSYTEVLCKEISPNGHVKLYYFASGNNIWQDKKKADQLNIVEDLGYYDKDENNKNNLSPLPMGYFDHLVLQPQYQPPSTAKPMVCPPEITCTCHENK